MVHKERKPFTQPLGQWPIIWAVATTLTTVAVCLYSLSLFRSTPQAPAPTPLKSLPIVNNIGALGRLEPQGEVIHLSASTSAEGTRIAQLLVNQGDRVRAGQVVAILDGHSRQLAMLEQAQKQVQVAQARLAQVQAGAKAGDIRAQKATIARLEAELYGDITTQQATIARLEAELRNSQTENWRYQQLYKDGAISALDSDNKRLRVETVQQQLNQATATLNRTVATTQKQLSEATATLSSITEVRPTDVQLAQVEVESTKAAVKKAQAELDLTYIRAPKAGQILKIHTRSGEIIGSEGIAELGQTNQMYVVAEVYETDIAKVRIGQSAIISSEVFAGKLKGTVTDVGLQVGRQNIFNIDPNADTDRKVVEVKIRINQPEDNMRIAGLTGLQVEVVINI